MRAWFGQGSRSSRGSCRLTCTRPTATSSPQRRRSTRAGPRSATQTASPPRFARSSPTAISESGYTTRSRVPWSTTTRSSAAGPP
jgi:hypothetical protein